jgi:hypothetical protein
MVRGVAVRIDSSLAGIDWEQAKADLAADHFDNGRSAEALRRSFAGQHVGLQTDEARELYRSLGFDLQPEFWSLVVGSWLDNDANR